MLEAELAVLEKLLEMNGWRTAAVSLEQREEILDSVAKGRSRVAMSQSYMQLRSGVSSGRHCKYPIHELTVVISGSHSLRGQLLTTSPPHDDINPTRLRANGHLASSDGPAIYVDMHRSRLVLGTP